MRFLDFTVSPDPAEAPTPRSPGGRVPKNAKIAVTKGHRQGRKPVTRPPQSRGVPGAGTACSTVWTSLAKNGPSTHKDRGPFPNPHGPTTYTSKGPGESWRSECSSS